LPGLVAAREAEFRGGDQSRELKTMKYKHDAPASELASAWFHEDTGFTRWRFVLVCIQGKEPCFTSIAARVCSALDRRSDICCFPDAAAFELVYRTEILRIDAANTFISVEFGETPADIAVLTLGEAAPLDFPRYALHLDTDVVGSPMVIVG
jgi:hypothetical protein